MGQSTANSGQNADCGKQQTAGADYIVHVYLAVLECVRNLYEQAQQHYYYDEHQYQVPVVGQRFQYDGRYLGAAFTAEFSQNLKCAAASGIGIVDGVNQIHQYAGRCHYDQYNLGEPIVPEFLLEMEREHHEQHIQGAYVHDSRSVKYQRSLQHGPDHTGQISLKGTPVIPDEDGVTD